MRKVKAVYSASDDPDFGTLKTEAVLIAPDMIMESDAGLNFLIIPPVPDDQEIVEIDRAKCGHFALSMLHSPKEEELDVDFLAKASFLDFIRKYASK